MWKKITHVVVSGTGVTSRCEFTYKDRHFDRRDAGWPTTACRNQAVRTVHKDGQTKRVCSVHAYDLTQEEGWSREAAMADNHPCPDCGKTWGWCEHTNPQALEQMKRKREQDQQELKKESTRKCFFCGDNAEFLAPQSVDRGKTVSWTPVCGDGRGWDDPRGAGSGCIGDFAAWWDGADWGPMPFKQIND